MIVLLTWTIYFVLNLNLGCFSKINLYGIFKTGFFFKKLSNDNVKKQSFLMLLWLQSLEIYVNICLHFALNTIKYERTPSEIAKSLILLNLYKTFKFTFKKHRSTQDPYDRIIRLKVSNSWEQKLNACSVLKSINFTKFL